ncbi:hypothetical protein EC957_001389 [Mortierella hygrophila]|uniref:Uncharacterized protein n=1 Tax=Mortierella hygrophila TaxID=979708 RepID=A0A9P6F5J6_9FUNG|nr:hypothetical protein EC957_001389 [Mortierella hygrophila]
MLTQQAIVAAEQAAETMAKQVQAEAYQQFGQQTSGIHIFNNSNAVAGSIGTKGTIVLPHQEDRSQQQQLQIGAQDSASPTAPPVLPDLTLGASSPSSR